MFVYEGRETIPCIVNLTVLEHCCGPFGVSVFQRKSKVESLTRQVYRVAHCGHLSSDAKKIIEEMDDGDFTIFTTNDSSNVWHEERWNV